MEKIRDNLTTNKSKRAKDALKVMREAVPERKRPSKEKKDNPLVRCLACGRTTQADMFTDVSMFSAEITGGVDFACDGCTSKWRRKGLI